MLCSFSWQVRATFSTLCEAFEQVCAAAFLWLGAVWFARVLALLSCFHACSNFLFKRHFQLSRLSFICLVVVLS